MTLEQTTENPTAVTTLSYMPGWRMEKLVEEGEEEKVEVVEGEVEIPLEEAEVEMPLTIFFVRDDQEGH